MAEISDIVPVTISYSDSRGVVRREFQSLLGMTTGLDAGGDLVVDIQPSGAGKVLQIDNIGDARIAFREGSEALELAIAYFEMRPVPRSPLYVGRYNSAARHFEYRGGGEAGSIAAMKTITAGEFTFNGVDIAALNLGPAADEDAVSLLIQAAINGNVAFSDVRVTWDSERTLFFITSVAAGTSDIAEGWVSTSDVAAEDTTALGLDNGVLIREAMLETIPDALRNIREANRDWLFVMPTKEIPANDPTAHDEITEWAQTQDDPITPLIRIGDIPTLSKVIDSEGVTLFNTQRGASVIWDRDGDDDYKNAQIGAFYGSLRLSQGDTVRTMQGLQLVGRAPAYGLTSTQERALRDLRINAYVPLGRLAIMREGTILTPDVWFDTNLYLAWFKNIIQSSIANLILRGELSLDAEGATIIKTRLENDCRLAVANGMISPGQVSDETARAIANFSAIGEFDGMLPTGYYVAVRDPNTIPIEERPNRIGPATRIWLTGSNRIHNLPIGIFITQ